MKRNKNFQHRISGNIWLLALFYCIPCYGESIVPLQTATDLNIGESVKLKLSNGRSAELILNWIRKLFSMNSEMRSGLQGSKSL
jgi:hypothetical protein